MTDVRTVLFDFLAAIAGGEKSAAPPESKMFSVSPRCVACAGWIG
jgi:hypothetical protein